MVYTEKKISVWDESKLRFVLYGFFMLNRKRCRALLNLTQNRMAYLIKDYRKKMLFFYNKYKKKA